MHLFHIEPRTFIPNVARNYRQQIYHNDEYE